MEEGDQIKDPTCPVRTILTGEAVAVTVANEIKESMG
jgi:hypothetical protein